MKTRLIPLLGSEASASLQRALLRRVLALSRAADCGPVVLYGTPSAHDPFFLECARRYGMSLVEQRRTDLGARMHHALATTLTHSQSAVLIGTDCAVLTVNHLREAYSALEHGCDAVIGPAEDGGYYLIGLRRSDPRLFSDIAWGAASVMASTRERLQELGYRWYELETLWDVDRPADYMRLMRLTPPPG